MGHLSSNPTSTLEEVTAKERPIFKITHIRFGIALISQAIAIFQNAWYNGLATQLNIAILRECAFLSFGKNAGSFLASSREVA